MVISLSGDMRVFMSTTIPHLKKMFAAVPQKYDLINRTLTLGLDAHWRDLAVKTCLEKEPSRVLDLCTGTGDLAIALAKQSGISTQIAAADFNTPMLEKARQKAIEAKIENRISFGLVDAAELPFEDASFDVVGISFGFRNLTFNNNNADKHLSEIARVIKSSGRFVIVESSQPKSRFVKLGFFAYLRAFVRPVGGTISGERSAYRYLAYSMKHFYTNEEVKNLLLEAGFSSVETTPLLLGVSAIHVATR
jgi:demethylmenaquinone methyltransferase / 2-methoxy-6-polyprenyl-1,4-benzoquinol methylase